MVVRGLNDDMVYKERRGKAGATNAGYILTDSGMEDDLLPNYGREVCNHIQRVAKELDDYNPSGRYKEYIPWLVKEDKPAEPADIIAAMDKRSGCRSLHL
eukprot:scaffold200592_cov51-Prasinocladus_malaysianus.AAC.3